MFLVTGVGAFGVVVFYFMIHVFFKVLFFFGSGLVIYVMNVE